MAMNAAEIMKRAFQNFGAVAKRDPKVLGAVEIDVSKIATEMSKAAHSFGPEGDLEALEKAIDEIDTFIAKLSHDPATDLILAPESEIAKRFAKGSPVEVEKAKAPDPAPAPTAPPAEVAKAASTPVITTQTVPTPPAAETKVEKADPAPAAPTPTPAPAKAPVKKAAIEDRWALDMASELADIKKAKKAKPPETDGDPEETDAEEEAEEAQETADQESGETKKVETAPVEKTEPPAESTTETEKAVTWEDDLSPAVEKGTGSSRLSKIADSVRSFGKRASLKKAGPSGALSPDQIASLEAMKKTPAEKVRKARIKDLKAKGYEPGMGYQDGLVDGVLPSDAG